MGSLEYVRRYIEGFHCFDFFKFQALYNNLYLGDSNLKDTLEFSLQLGPSNAPSLRFGLFKLHDPAKVAAIIQDRQPEAKNIESLISAAKRFAPEMALGFDFSSRERTKLYLLRLPDNSEFRKNPRKYMDELCRLNGLPPVDLTDHDLNDCYLIGIDFSPPNLRSIKVYTRRMQVDFTEMRAFLSQHNIQSVYLELFSGTFDSGALNDTTVSKRYAKDPVNTQQVAIFFELESGRNRDVENIIRTCIPAQFPTFTQTMQTLENATPITYSHIGLTFHKRAATETLSVYFSPHLSEAGNA